MSGKKGKRETKGEGMREGDTFVRVARGYKGQSSAEIHIPRRYEGKFCKVVVLEGL
jgi:hypothetical protein